jgi:hypothetical protein
VRKIPIPRLPDPGKRTRARAYAAGTQMRTVTSTTAPPTSAVLVTHVEKFVFSKR